ncbi:hypothetical protein [Bacteroides rodentium]
MRLKSFFSILAGAALMFSACSPEEYEMGAKTYVSDDLVEGIAYTVTPDANDPNTIHLTSLIKGATPLWVTPSGPSQKTTLDLALPFAGEYSVTFGASTPAGPVYGEPYTFKVETNNFAMLEDPIWANLAGGVGKSRKWVPIDKNFGIGRCSGPVMYMSPNDVKNDGSNITDLMIGSANWTPNWDPGIQSWLIPADDPYFQSYITFGLDAVKGCTVELHRVAASGTTDATGTFNLNVSDPKRPLISFYGGTYSLHNEGFDDVCSNYTNDIKIIECTPYLLQVATMRTNSEGPWWLVWNFISEEAYNDPSVIPTEDPGLLQPAEVQQPAIEDLATKLFTTEINGVTYVGNEARFLINDEEPYDWTWWNGGSAAWESVVKGQYGSSWAPVADASIADYELVLSSTADGYKWDDGTNTGKLAIEDGKLKFMDVDGNPVEITVLTATGDKRTVEVKGSEFTVMACDVTSSFQMGVPATTNDKGAVDSYLCANLNYKPIATGPTGPTEIKVDNSKVQIIFGDGNPDRLRLQLYNPWGGGDAGWPIDITKVKLKKNQTLKIQYKVLSGISWNEGATPKTVIMDNNIGNAWEDDCYNLVHAVAFDTAEGAVQTVSVTNTTGATVTYEGSSCICIGIQNKGLATVAATEDGQPDVKVEIISMTIE